MSEVLTDELVMLEVASGRADRLALLVRRHATRLLTFIHRLVGDRHRAEDLFQEVFLAVWTQRRRYEYPRPFRPWLYTIALNRCRAYLRLKRPSLVAIETLPLVQAGSSPESGVRDRELAEIVLDAVQRLPTQQRLVVSLRIWEELPYAQIAEMMELSEPTVRSHMHHALASLRRELSPTLEIDRT